MSLIILNVLMLLMSYFHRPLLYVQNFVNLYLEFCLLSYFVYNISTHVFMTSVVEGCSLYIFMSGFQY